ncbi:GIP, partial [Symbiodinium sp. CCMP2592]
RVPTEWAQCSVTAAKKTAIRSDVVKKLLQGNFVRLDMSTKATSSSKKSTVAEGALTPTWVCLNCALHAEGRWTSVGVSPTRCIYHLLGPISEQAYKDLHGVDEVPEQMKAFVKSVRGDKTIRNRGCPQYKPDAETIRELLAAGENHVLPWAKLAGLVALDEEKDEKVLEPLTEAELTDAKRLHVVTAAVQAVSVRGVSHPVSDELFQLLSRGQYTPPKRHEFHNLLESMHKELQSKVDAYFAKGGPWALVHDGASSKDEQLLNVLAESADGEVLFVDLVDAGSDKKTSQYIAQLLKESVTRCLFCLQSLQFALPAGALAILKEELGPGFSGLGCLEHAGELLAKDVMDVFPWLGKIVKDAHFSQRVFRKKKKLNHFIRRNQADAKKDRKLRRIVKLKVLRRTRFASAFDVTQAFNENSDFMRDLMTSQAWKDLTRPKGKAAEARVERAEKLWNRQPTLERCRRAESILQPVKAFTRKAGKMHLAAMVPAWFQMEKNLIDVCRKRDFVDRMTKEDPEVKSERLQQLQTVLSNRREQFLRGEHACAFVMDPSMR